MSLFNRRIFITAALASMAMPRPVLSQGGRDPANQEPSFMKIKMHFAEQDLIATLYDNPSARDFYAMLPLNLTIDNYANNEKIAYLPRKLTDEASGAFGNEQPYDLCYFKPWGNLALFYAPYRYSSGLIRLGRFDEGKEALHIKGEFPLHITQLQ